MTIFVIIMATFAHDSSASIEMFRGNYAKTVWRSQIGSPVKPQRNVHSGNYGIKLSCPFSNAGDRYYWDADIPLDLSGTSGFSLSIKLKDPAAVSGGTLYFRSGNGWYSGWFTVSKTETGRQDIQLSRSDFVPDGTPSGWANVNRVRIALWKGAAKDTVAMIADLTAHSDEIILVYNNDSSKTHPEEVAPIKRAVENVSSWLKSCGITAGHFNYNDIAKGIPPGCKLVILPYNPYPAKTTVPALTEFTAQGGKIIVAYSLSPEIAPLLGLSGKTWQKTGPDQTFSSIKFKATSSDGLPLVMHQNSWNAHIPEIKNADILGYWQDGSGKPTGIPAVTINKNGIYIGHILTRFDHENKIQFLMAVASMLRPDMKSQFMQGIFMRSESLLTLKDWPTTRAFIKKTLIRQKQTDTQKRKVSQELDDIDSYRQVTAGLLKSATSGELINRASTTRKLIQQSYYRAMSNNTKDEFRGIWCHDAQGIQGMKWRDIAKKAKDSGFNALLPNMLWTGCAYYPSSIVPPPQPSDPNQGDMLKDCLKACKKEGIELHMWKVCWNLDQASPEFIKKMRDADRLQKKTDGSSVSWLCPSDPRNRDMELSAAVEVARKYKVDGIHYDYIRYPDSESCYCQGCRKRFEKAISTKISNWPEGVISGANRQRFKTWRRDQITSFVAQSSKAIKAARKGIAFSVAVYGSWPSCRDSIGQDWVKWARQGYVDFICPMNYVTDDKEAQELITKQLLSAGTRTPIYPGLGPSTMGLPPEQVIHQVDIIRQAGAKGFLLFEIDKDLLEIHLPALREGATANN